MKIVSIQISYAPIIEFKKENNKIILHLTLQDLIKRIFLVLSD